MRVIFKKFKPLFLADLGLFSILYFCLLVPFLHRSQEDFIAILCIPSITLFSQILLPMFGRYVRSRIYITTEEIAVVVSLQAICTSLFYAVPVINAATSVSKGLAFLVLSTVWSTLWFLLSLVKAPFFFKAPALGMILFYAYAILLLFLPDIFYQQAHDEGSYGMTFALGVQIPTLFSSALVGTPLLGRHIKKAGIFLPCYKKILLSFVVFLSLSFSYSFTDLYIIGFDYALQNNYLRSIASFSLLPALLAAITFFLALCIPIKQKSEFE